MRKVYLVLSHTHSGIANTIHFITKDKYAHASISLDDKCNQMYSFGRKYIYIPFYGVFLKENLKKGLYKNKKATMVMYEIDVSEEQYQEIVNNIKDIKKTNHGYNIIGLFLAYFKIKLNRNKYYCSEFVYEVLSNNGVNVYDETSVRFKPMDLINKNFTKIYEGKVSDFIHS